MKIRVSLGYLVNDCRLHQHAKKWRPYVDDTLVYVKNESIDYVLTTLNKFRDNISSTYGKNVTISYRF